MRGLRIHIAGSASLSTEPALLGTAHSVIRAFVNEVISLGAGLVLGAGAEPRNAADEPCIFDWTALEALAEVVDPGPEWPALRPERFVVVASQRALEKVPADRINVWDRCTRRSDLDLEVAPPGWRMAGIVRERQVQRGDVLVVLGGGGGVEHLAELYIDEGKPVIPVHCDLDSLNNDGNGGSRFLYDRAIATPNRFLRLMDGKGSASARLTHLRLTAQSDPTLLSHEIATLVADLQPRPAFYVRLLDTSHPDHAAVEAFFRGVVDDVVVERGFTPREMGRGRPENAFMNVEIFSALHRAGLVIVDLTGTRPNCTMELGYALARRRRVVIGAMKGTILPFDEDKLPTFMWDPSDDPSRLRVAFLRWFDVHGELPPIIS